MFPVAAFSPAGSFLPVIPEVQLCDSLPDTQYEGILCLRVCVDECLTAIQFPDRHQSLSLSPVLWLVVWVSDDPSDSPQSAGYKSPLSLLSSPPSPPLLSSGVTVHNKLVFYNGIRKIKCFPLNFVKWIFIRLRIRKTKDCCTLRFITWHHKATKIDIVPA